MKRNVALFGASLTVGALGAVGLVVTSTSSSAAPATDSFAGAAWQISAPDDASSWTTGPIGGMGNGLVAEGSASITQGMSATVTGFSEPVLSDATITVTTTCVDGAPSVTVVGGGAPGTYGPGSKPVSAAKFLNSPDALGTVTFASKMLDGYTVGAYVDQTQQPNASMWFALTGANCAAASPTTSPTSTSSPTSTTSPTSTSSPTGTSSASPTSTTSPTSSPTGSASPTSSSSPTEPPTPTPTTTTLPVTG